MADRPSPFGAVIRAWFGLTAREQQAILLVTALAILGLLVRHWHLSRTADEPVAEPVAIEQDSVGW